ncbi:MAG: phosphotransferase [Coriobacteriaceae bacterium]|nr:phosphotransferase [Coriobacteriaceae bacterium]
MITSGIAADKQQQKASLAWIRQQSLDPRCVESLANHDPDIAPHVIGL